jgi:hypothetical protein
LAKGAFKCYRFSQAIKPDENHQVTKTLNHKGKIVVLCLRDFVVWFIMVLILQNLYAPFGEIKSKRAKME